VQQVGPDDDERYDGEHDRPDDLHRRGRIALSEHDPRAASPARAGRMLL